MHHVKKTNCKTQSSNHLVTPGFTDDSHEDGLVHAALKQNVRGVMIQPLSPLQWVHLTALTLFPVLCQHLEVCSFWVCFVFQNIGFHCHWQRLGSFKVLQFTYPCMANILVSGWCGL